MGRWWRGGVEEAGAAGCCPRRRRSNGQRQSEWLAGGRARSVVGYALRMEAAVCVLARQARAVPWREPGAGRAGGWQKRRDSSSSAAESAVVCFFLIFFSSSRRSFSPNQKHRVPRPVRTLSSPANARQSEAVSERAPDVRANSLSRHSSWAPPLPRPTAASATSRVSAAASSRRPAKRQARRTSTRPRASKTAGPGQARVSARP